MSENTKEIPVWVGRESGQRKRYLRSLEKDLAAELGPDWRDKIADSAESSCVVSTSDEHERRPELRPSDRCESPGQR